MIRSFFPLNTGKILIILSNVANKVSNFLILLILAKSQSPSDLGRISMILTLAALIFPTCTLSVSESFLALACRRVQTLSKIHQLFISALSIGVLGIMIAIFVLVIFQGFGSKSSALDWLEGLSSFLLYLFPYLFFTLVVNLFRVYGRNDLFAIYSGSAPLVLCTLVAAAASVGLSAHISILWIGCYALFSILLILFATTKRLRKALSTSINYSIKKELVAYGAPLTLGVLASIASLSIDILIIGILLSKDDVALYRVATMLPMALLMIPNSVLSADFKALVRSTSEPERLLKYYLFFVFRYLIISSFLVVFIYFFSTFFISEFFGEEYCEAARLMRIFGIILPIHFCLRLPLGTLFNAVGKAKTNVYIAYFVLLLLVLLLYKLIPPYGLEGVVYANLISHFLGGVLSLVIFCNGLDLPNGYLPSLLRDFSNEYFSK